MKIITDINSAVQIIKCAFYLYRNNIHDNRILSKIKNKIDISKDSISPKDLMESLSFSNNGKGNVFLYNNLNSNNFIIDILNSNKFLKSIKIVENTSYNTSRLSENNLIWEYSILEVRIDLNYCKSPNICEAILECELYKPKKMEKVKYTTIQNFQKIVENINLLDDYKFEEEKEELLNIFKSLSLSNPKNIVIFPEQMVK